MIKKNPIQCCGLLTALSLSLFSLNALADDTNTTDSATNTITDSATNAVSANSADADNSGKNVRDRNGETRTPFDQGNSKADTRLTRKIRRSVMNETNNFSMLAKNIKIITRDGKVTLRGPVKSDEEKSDIEKIATQIAGENNVNDLLEVKQDSSAETQTNSVNQN
jgi:osmotically-inducible protein OsmY